MPPDMPLVAVGWVAASVAAGSGVAVAVSTGLVEVGVGWLTTAAVGVAVPPPCLIGNSPALSKTIAAIAIKAKQITPTQPPNPTHSHGLRFLGGVLSGL
jgi:hypothetical protein